MKAARHRNVYLLVALLSCVAQGQHESDELLKIAREYRDGKDGAMKSPLRAARFYELLIERTSSSSSDENTASENRRDAELDLAELLEVDPTLSKRYSYLGLLVQSASRGHADAQHKLAVAYGTGIAARDLTPMDPGRSLFLEYISALSGNVLANLGMGYRYSTGIGVTESCEAALPHYQYAADHAAESIQVYGVHAHQPDTLKLSEANDPTRMSRRDGTLELADYYAHLADQGDALAAVTLGNMLLTGTRNMALNETLALRYLNIAAEAQNPAGAGLQGYVLLNQYMEEVERVRKQEGLTAAQQYAQSPSGAHRADKFLKLLQFAHRKGDANGIVGLGLAYFHGIGYRANLTKALDLLERAATSHPDAGYFIGEICMGLPSMELSGLGSDKSRARFKAQEVRGAEGQHPVRGATPAETRTLQSQAVTHAVQSKEIDPAAAARAYSISAQLGNVLSQHRLAHLYKRGMGGPTNCKEVVKLFKSVAEKGPWMDALAVAHKHYAAGNEMAALHLFAELAAVGVESAQYNAAYILSRCTRCPPVNKAAAQGVVTEMSRGGGRSSVASMWGRRSAAQDSQNAADALEKQHRSLKHSTATDFRGLLKLHEQREHDAARAAEAVRVEQARPSVITNRPNGDTTAIDAVPSGRELQAWRSAAFLPAATWREFLSQYDPDSLVDPLDLEFGSALVAKRNTAEYQAQREAARMTHCEARALTLFDLSAQQGNSEAYMQLGDFYYYQRAGLLQAERKREAAEFYQKAADLHHTQAIFNLGIMHEVGDGVSQDFHLAKRYYDQAAEVDAKARVPRDIALMVLEGHKTFNSLFGPQALPQLLNTAIPVPVSWTDFRFQSFTVWELLERAAVLERQLRRRVDAWMLWYCERVLQPSRQVADVLGGSPLGRVTFTGAGGPSEGTTAKDYARKAASLPELLRAFYDRAFETAFRFVYYIVRGQPHPPLSERQSNHTEVMQLREELLLVAVLAVVFVVLLVTRVLRRRFLLAAVLDRPNQQAARA